MRVEEALVSELLADATVGGLVSTRVYHLQLPQKPTYPAITYQRISTTQGDIMEGVDTRTQVRIQVDAWGRSVSSVKGIADACRTLLAGKRGAFGAVGSPAESLTLQHCRLESEQDLADFSGDDEIRRVSMDFMFILHE